MPSTSSAATIGTLVDDDADGIRRQEVSTR